MADVATNLGAGHDRRTDPLRDHHVVVVGAGIAGLVSALQLAAQGLRVTVIERAAAPGGKLRQVSAAGAPVDSGPTVFTMRWVFEQIFQRAGTSLDSHLRLIPLEVLARHAWSGDERLDLYADPGRSAEAIGDFSGPQEARRFVKFCDQARQLYATLEGPYIRSERPTLASMTTDLGINGMGMLAGLGPFASLWRSLARHFHDPRLQQLFGRYATYCGSSPFAAPATLMLIAQVEMDGVWAVEGGMIALARALADLAAARGAELRYGQQCEEILLNKGAVSGIRLAGGEIVAADAVVFNGDVAALSAGLLGHATARAVPRMDVASRSLSALTWSINAATDGFPLVRHNVFFCDDYPAEFRDIFKHRRLPRNGTVYVCAQDRDDSAQTPGTSERLLCLVNAPATGDQTARLNPPSQQEIDECEQTSFALLRRCGLSIDMRPDNSVRTTPADFHRLFPATGGALYGQASHGWMDVFRRPSSTSRVPGLYLAGGSTHPGPGIPMAAMSGQLAAATLMAHLDSTRRSHRVVISGGISMRSVMTANTG